MSKATLDECLNALRLWNGPQWEKGHVALYQEALLNLTDDIGQRTIKHLLHHLTFRPAVAEITSMAQQFMEEDYEEYIEKRDKRKIAEERKMITAAHNRFTAIDGLQKGVEEYHREKGKPVDPDWLKAFDKIRKRKLNDADVAQSLLAGTLK